jgi:hypothetical protein
MDLTYRGECDGTHVVQGYVDSPAAAVEPRRQRKAFLNLRVGSRKAWRVTTVFMSADPKHSRYSGSLCSPRMLNESSARGVPVPGCPPPTVTR